MYATLFQRLFIYRIVSRIKPPTVKKKFKTKTNIKIKNKDSKDTLPRQIKHDANYMIILHVITLEY